MCELLGISAKRRKESNALLREFFARAEQHPHGWGLARFPNAGGKPLVEKEPVKATESEALRRILGEPVDDSTILAHVRFATVGTMEYANCHPFTAADNSGRVWTLIHNGTVFDGAKLNDYIGVQYGETDSERVLLHLVALIDKEQIHRRRALDADERFDVLSAAIAGLSAGSKLNLLVHDGEFMYAHTNFRDSLYFLGEDDAVVFSTRPLAHGTWEPVPFTRLIAVRDGEFVRESEPHGNEYILNPEDYRLAYMAFARL